MSEEEEEVKPKKPMNDRYREITKPHFVEKIQLDLESPRLLEACDHLSINPDELIVK